MPSLKSAGFEPAILDRLLANLDVNLHDWAAYRIAPAVSLSLPPTDAATVTYVVAGGGGVRIGTRNLHPIEPRSIIVVPAGLELAWGSGAEVIPPKDDHIQPFDQNLVSLMRAERPLQEMVVVTSRVSASFGPRVGLFDHLREPIIDRLDQGDPVRFSFELMIAEIAAPDLGSRAMVEACLRQFLILLFRRYLQVDSGSLPKALLDQQLARALISVIEHPEVAHSIKSLSRTAGISRSAFAKRFRDAFGQSPLEYVHSLRMQLASRLLSSTDLPVKVIGGRAGYSSRSYFSRAFRAHFGLDPSAFRIAESNRIPRRSAST